MARLSVRYGYNGVPWAMSADARDAFFFDADAVERPLMAFGDEMVRAARDAMQIYHGEQIHVLYSGGLDSEAVLEAFLRAGARVVAHVLVDTKGSNFDELRHARAYLCKRQADVHEHLLDFSAWMASDEALSLAEKSEQIFPSAMMPLKLAVEHPELVWFMGEEIGVKDGALEIHEYEYGLIKLMMRYGIRGHTGLVLWDTEVLHSWLADPIMREVSSTASSYDGKKKSRMMRVHLGLAPREKTHWRIPPALPGIHRRQVRYKLERWLDEHLMVTA